MQSVKFSLRLQHLLCRQTASFVTRRVFIHSIVPSVQQKFVVQQLRKYSKYSSSGHGDNQDSLFSEWKRQIKQNLSKSKEYQVS